LLAKEGGNAGLSTPITATAEGPCIVVAGNKANFDGANHAITGANGHPAILITGAEAYIRNTKVEGGKTGIQIQGADATLYHATITNAARGIVADGASGLRIERATVTGGEVALDLGEQSGGTVCKPGATVRNPAVVVQHSQFTGAKLGISACEALPVLSHVTVTGNEIGLLVGEPKADPKHTGKPGAANAYDPCVCAPSLDDVRPETTLFYSSGCGGCEVHEGWLPEVRGRGHDVRLRLTGQENKAEQDRFDAYTRRCAPAIIDAIGTPGCVPNYACVATGARFKAKGDDGRLVFDAQLNSAEQVAEFAGQCNTEAFTRHSPGGATCVTQAIRDSRFCGNTKADVNGARGAGVALKGSNNACGAPNEGGFDVSAIGCDMACDAAPAAPAPVAPSAPAPAQVPASAAAAPAPAAAAAPVSAAANAGASTAVSTAPATSASASAAKGNSSEHTDPNLPWWYKWVGVAGAGYLALRLWMKFKK
jgi:hypothetical protein